MDYDDAYANAAYIDGATDYPDKWADAAQDYRIHEAAAGRAQLNVPYGEKPRQQYDLFMANGPAQGVVIFVHGGYWRMFDNKSWSHLAAGPFAHDWAVAMPSYTLTPEASIPEITREIAMAVEAVAKVTRGPISLVGHSAGGHLVARMLCGDVDLSEGVVRRLHRVMPISPLSDMRPLIHTKMNDDFKMDMKTATAESPLLAGVVCNVRTHVWVGANERPVFLDQAQWLADSWENASLTVAPDKHHFSVIDDLQDPASEMVSILVSE